jgi:hypothetical protein
MAFALNIAFFYECSIEMAFALAVSLSIDLLRGETALTYITVDGIARSLQDPVSIQSTRMHTHCARKKNL